MVVITEIGAKESRLMTEERYSPAYTSSRPKTAPSFRVVQQLRKEHVQGRPSSQHRKYVHYARAYMIKKVDPVMARVITELVIHKPVNVALAMLDYFRWRQEGQPEVDDPTHMFRLRMCAEKSDRLYAVRHLTPVLSELMSRLALDRPENLDSYMVEVLTAKVLDSKGAATGAGTIEEEECVGGDPSPRPPRAQKGKGMTVLVLGADGAGKTTLLASLQGDREPQVMPTTGFRPVHMKLEDGCKVRFYDLGGGSRIRDIWASYYHDVHGVIFVIDAADHERWLESLDLLNTAMCHKYLAGKPLLVMVNKQDMRGAKSADMVRRNLVHLLQQELGKGWAVHGCVAHSPFNSGVIDPRVEIAVEGLFDRMRADMDSIEARVREESAEVEASFERERAAKDRQVLKGLIDRALIQDKEECFSNKEGLEFLAAELGEEVGALESVAMAVAEAVGYQKLALQMVGAMRCPISKKKVPLQWDEIATVISDIRRELGLSPVRR
nr:Arl13 [Vischeria sp. CAUP Q 202]